MAYFVLRTQKTSAAIALAAGEGRIPACGRYPSGAPGGNGVETAGGQARLAVSVCGRLSSELDAVHKQKQPPEFSGSCLHSVELVGFEPATPCLQSRCSSQLS